MLQNARYLMKAVAIHHVHHKHGSIGRRKLLHKGQNFLGGHLLHYIIIEGYLFTGFKRGVLVKPMVFSVMTDGRVDQNGTQPGFERQRIVVAVQVLKGFQKPFVQDIFGLFGI